MWLVVNIDKIVDDRESFKKNWGLSSGKKVKRYSQREMQLLTKVPAVPEFGGGDDEYLDAVAEVVLEEETAGVAVGRDG